MKIVLDTNIIISGLFFAGPPNLILHNIFAGKYRLILSKQIINEYFDIATKFTEKMHIDDLLPSLKVLHNLVLISSSVQIYKSSPPECADKNHRLFLQTATCGQAKYMIAEDENLLGIGSYRGGKVVRLQEFLAIANKS